MLGRLLSGWYNPWVLQVTMATSVSTDSMGSLSAISLPGCIASATNTAATHAITYTNYTTNSDYITE